MRIIAVDDEKMALEAVADAIREVDLNIEVVKFTESREALEYMQHHPCEIAFLDIQMPEIGGVELARRMKRINPSVNIIFTTGYSEYMADAFDLHVSGYIMKPVTFTKVQKELANLRHPISHAPKKRVRIKCFGNFEVFVDGTPMTFGYEKSREYLAYLVDRCGAMATTREIMAVIFGDGDHGSYMRNIRKNLVDTLKAHSCEEILINEWGRMGIDTTQVECDYYEWKLGNREGRNAYYGEYMSNYSWAEVTNATLFWEKENKNGEG